MTIRDTLLCVLSFPYILHKIHIFVCRQIQNILENIPALFSPLLTYITFKKVLGSILYKIYVFYICCFVQLFLFIT